MSTHCNSDRDLFGNPEPASTTTTTATPPSSPSAFGRELRALMQARLRGELSFEDFARLNLELHFRHGRPGYDHEQYERDLAAHRHRATDRAAR